MVILDSEKSEFRHCSHTERVDMTSQTVDMNIPPSPFDHPPKPPVLAVILPSPFDYPPKPPVLAVILPSPFDYPPQPPTTAGTPAVILPSPFDRSSRITVDYQPCDVKIKQFLELVGKEKQCPTKCPTDDEKSFSVVDSQEKSIKYEHL